MSHALTAAVGLPCTHTSLPAAGRTGWPGIPGTSVPGKAGLGMSVPGMSVPEMSVLGTSRPPRLPPGPVAVWGALLLPQPLSLSFAPSPLSAEALPGHLATLRAVGSGLCWGLWPLPRHSPALPALPQGTMGSHRAQHRQAAGCLCQPTPRGKARRYRCPRRAAPRHMGHLPASPSALSPGPPGRAWSRWGHSMGWVARACHRAGNAGPNPLPGPMVGTAPQPGSGGSSQPPTSSTCRPQRTACSSSGCRGNALLMTAAYFAMATGGKGSLLAAVSSPGAGAAPPLPSPCGAELHTVLLGPGAIAIPLVGPSASPLPGRSAPHAPETAAPTLPCSAHLALRDGACSSSCTWCPGAGTAGGVPASLLGSAPFLLPLWLLVADVPSWAVDSPASSTPPPYQHPLPGKCHRQDRALPHGARHVTLPGVGADTHPCSHVPPSRRHPGGLWGTLGTRLLPVRGRGSAVPTPRCDGMQGREPPTGRPAALRAGREGGQGGQAALAQAGQRAGSGVRPESVPLKAGREALPTAAGSQACLRQTPIYLLRLPTQFASAGQRQGHPAAPCPARTPAQAQRPAGPARACPVRLCRYLHAQVWWLCRRPSLPSACNSGWRWGNCLGCRGPKQHQNLWPGVTRQAGWWFLHQIPTPAPATLFPRAAGAWEDGCRAGCRCLRGAGLGLRAPHCCCCCLCAHAFLLQPAPAQAAAQARPPLRDLHPARTQPTHPGSSSRPTSPGARTHAPGLAFSWRLSDNTRRSPRVRPPPNTSSLLWAAHTRRA